MKRQLLIPALTVLISGAAAGFAAPDSEPFLDELEQRCIRYFLEQRNPDNGLVADRARAHGAVQGQTASIAALGFGLTGLCIADERGWLLAAEARQQATTALRWLLHEAPQEHGFFYHFLDLKTGQRVWDCEVSSIDTALLMAGVLTLRQYYHGTEIETLATQLYERVDWPWMLNGDKTLAMGWKPETGFLDARWDRYSEHLILYLLGLGSPTHPLPADCWLAWKREPVLTYAGYTYLQCPPLFTHQYSQAWVDFRDKRDAFADYWRNSELATLAQRRFCLDLRGRFITYGPDVWGLSASDSPKGYVAWGGPAERLHPAIDGTVVPCAVAGSLPLAPRECLDALRYMRDLYGAFIWGRYGFIDAYNPGTGWTALDVIGIDVGISLLMAENWRTGFVWRYFMLNPEIHEALRRAGFYDTAPTLARADAQYLTLLTRDTWAGIESLVDPATGLPFDSSDRGDLTSLSDIGLYLTDVTAAWALGLIAQDQAEARLDLALSSLPRLQLWQGFPTSWNSLKTLTPASHDAWISMPDSAALAAGLITVSQAFPRFSQVCTSLVEAMDWAQVYDPECRLLHSGYDLATGKLATDSHLELLGTEGRLAVFLAVASGKVPPVAWKGLKRGTEERYSARFLKPGWEGGGLCRQYLSGLWLDERDTLMGQSAANLAYAQMERARTEGLPVWGWSANASSTPADPEWGKIEDHIVTPHASALAIDSFPRAVVANLQAFEELGLRRPGVGFADAVDVTTSLGSETFRLASQSMLFISLANCLTGDTVRNWFQSHPLVLRGRRIVADYRWPAYGPNISVFTLQPRPPDLAAAGRR